MNKAAESMLDVNSHDILDKNFRKVLTGEYLSMANKIFEQAEEGGRISKSRFLPPWPACPSIFH